MRKSKKILLTALAAGMLLVPGMMASAQEETAVTEQEMPVVNDMSKYMNVSIGMEIDVEIDVFYGNWVAQDGGWWFKGEDGSYPTNDIFEIDGVDYGFDESGWMVTGWHYYSQYDSWFYFKDNGVMAKGWVNDGGMWYYTDPEDGFMYYNCINRIDGSYYAFQDSGAMVANSWYLESGHEHWVYATESGALKEGWHYENGSWYYLGYGDWNWMEPGIGLLGIPYMAKGISYAEDNYYIFDQSGRMVYGGWTNIYGDWIDTDNEWLYANPDGTAYNGWLQEGGNWYFISRGIMRNNGSHKDEVTGKVYLLQKGGVMASTPGWYAIVHRDYANLQEYKEVTGWYYVKDVSGELYADGTWEINGKEYRFDIFGECLNP